jgi:hypothetical protein
MERKGVARFFLCKCVAVATSLPASHHKMLRVFGRRLCTVASASASAWDPRVKLGLKVGGFMGACGVVWWQTGVLDDVFSTSEWLVDAARHGDVVQISKALAGGKCSTFHVRTLARALTSDEVPFDPRVLDVVIRHYPGQVSEAVMLHFDLLWKESSFPLAVKVLTNSRLMQSASFPLHEKVFQGAAFRAALEHVVRMDDDTLLEVLLNSGQSHVKRRFFESYGVRKFLEDCINHRSVKVLKKLFESNRAVLFQSDPGAGKGLLQTAMSSGNKLAGAMLLSFSDSVVSTEELKPHAASLLAWLVSQYECHDPGHGKREWIQVALERLLALTNVESLLEGSSKVEKDTDPWVLGVKAFRCSPGRHGRILRKIKAAHENSVDPPSGLWAEVMANPWKDLLALRAKSLPHDCWVFFLAKAVYLERPDYVEQVVQLHDFSEGELEDAIIAATRVKSGETYVSRNCFESVRVLVRAAGNISDTARMEALGAAFAAVAAYGDFYWLRALATEHKVGLDYMGDIALAATAVGNKSFFIGTPQADVARKLIKKRNKGLCFSC